MTCDINISMLTQQPIRPICKNCNELPARPSGRTSRGFQRWHTLCSHCAKQRYGRKKKKSQCEICEFVAVDGCQLCLINEKTICQNCNALRLQTERKLNELTVDATVDWSDIRL
jgi:type II secretory ATPase GspE/PulE/Tfp pilus assembly ATPase PilB-like protein